MNRKLETILISIFIIVMAVVCADGATGYLPTNKNIKLTASKTHPVRLAWNTLPGATSHRIYWGVKSGVYTNFMTAPGAVINISVPGMVTGQKYFFLCRSYGANGREVSTPNEVTYTVPAKDVYDFTVVIIQSTNGSTPWTTTITLPLVVITNRLPSSFVGVSVGAVLRK